MFFFSFSKFWFFGLLGSKRPKKGPKWQKIVIFSKFWFSGLSEGWKGTKWPKITKISVCCTLYFRNHISYDLHLWYTCVYKRIISPGIFCILLKILIKKFCHTLYLRNHTSYDCDFWNTCQMMISPASFSFFQNFDFWDS